MRSVHTCLVLPTSKYELRYFFAVGCEQTIHTLQWKMKHARSWMIRKARNKKQKNICFTLGPNSSICTNKWQLKLFHHHFQRLHLVDLFFDRASLESFPATDENLASALLFIIYTASDSAILVGPLRISPGFARLDGAYCGIHGHRS